MQIIPFIEAKNTFNYLMDQVCEDHTHIIITKEKQSPVVMMSLEGYNELNKSLLQTQIQDT